MIPSKTVKSLAADNSPPADNRPSPALTLIKNSVLYIKNEKTKFVNAATKSNDFSFSGESIFYKPP